MMQSTKRTNPALWPARTVVCRVKYRESGIGTKTPARRSARAMRSKADVLNELLSNRKALGNTDVRLRKKSPVDARHMFSTVRGGLIVGPRWITTPNFDDLTFKPSSACPFCVSLLSMRPAKSLCNCSSGLVILVDILYSCHCFRRSSPAQSVSQEMCFCNSCGTSINIACACCLPRRSCSRAIAVTSSTPAGTTPALCWRIKLFPVETSPPDHQSLLPMGAPSESVEGSACSPLWWVSLCKPSAILRNPVRASFLTDQRASVFQGADRPFKGCSPG
mmetsp:Transcript_19672/g.52505  ORF Transcript_19672/g.52505 Transcript_19672/m.52505 type:complete len:277 (+) Transcript_19672:1430-2260(+)